jgi:hypothetical protein
MKMLINAVLSGLAGFVIGAVGGCYFQGDASPSCWALLIVGFALPYASDWLDLDHLTDGFNY